MSLQCLMGLAVPSTPRPKTKALPEETLAKHAFMRMGSRGGSASNVKKHNTPAKSRSLPQSDDGRVLSSIHFTL